MRNTFETIALGAALLTGCGQVGEARSFTETSTHQETTALHQERVRQKLTPETLRNIQWPAGEMTPNTKILADGDINVLFPELHHQDTGNPQIEALHRDLFLNIDFLIKNYDIAFVGFEGISEIEILQRLVQKPPFNGNQEIFLAYLIQTQQEGGQSLSQAMVEIFRIALKTTLTVDQRRAAIQPYIGKVPTRYLIEIIYGRNNSGVDIENIDMDNYLEWNAQDDELLGIAYAYEQELLTVVLDKTPTTPEEEITVQMAFQRAKRGDERAKTAYCSLKTAYDAAKTIRNTLIHSQRNRTVAEKIRRRPGNGVILFGTFHTEGLQTELPQETLAVIESTNLRAAATSFRENPTEPVTDANIFTPEREFERLNAIIPDLPKGCPKSKEM